MPKKSKEILPISITEFYDSAIQRGADYHFEKLMTDEYNSKNLITEIHNVRRALKLLKRGEIESDYSVEQIERKLAQLGF